MSGQEHSDYDLLTEHLGYPPVSLLDDIINTVNVLADRALDSVERLLLSIPPHNLGFNAKQLASQYDGAEGAAPSPEEAAKLEIENGTHQLETLLNASIDKNFDIFELYAMRNILTVAPADRPYVRLAHYEGLDFQAAASEDAPTEESVTGLRRRLHASLRLQVKLEEEQARNEALLESLRSALGHGGAGMKSEAGGEAGQSAFGFLRDKGGLEQGGSEKPITTTTQFTLSQLQALRSLSTSLRTILPDLAAAVADPQDATSSAPASWRRERVGYVEASSRKYLERAAGLELGPQGEVRDGEWQGEGRQLSRGDVEGLEKVVSLLGRGNERGESRGDGVEGDGEADDMDES